MTNESNPSNPQKIRRLHGPALAPPGRRISYESNRWTELSQPTGMSTVGNPTYAPRTIAANPNWPPEKLGTQPNPVDANNNRMLHSQSQFPYIPRALSAKKPLERKGCKFNHAGVAHWIRLILQRPTDWIQINPLLNLELGILNNASKGRRSKSKKD